MENNIQKGHFYLSRTGHGLYEVMSAGAQIAYKMVGGTIIFYTTPETFLQHFSYYNP